MDTQRRFGRWRTIFRGFSRHRSDVLFPPGAAPGAGDANRRRRPEPTSRAFPRPAVAVLVCFLALPPLFGQEFSEALPIPPLLEYRTDGDGTKVFRLVADEGEREFFPGRATRTLGYNGDYLGPTIRVRRNDTVAIQVENRLSDPTTVHWHGADVPSEADGGPHQGIRPRRSWTARFTVRQQAATLWYHPHFIRSTAQQVYEGLAGLFIVDDGQSDTLGIPNDYGTDDIPIILQERRFDQSGRFEYRPRMPDIMHGFFGNAVLANGAVQPFLEVGSGVNRLRVVNGSNSTVFRLRIDGIDSFNLIASDGGFLEAPVSVGYLVLSPGERAEILVDFAAGRPGPTRLVADTNAGAKYEVMEFRIGAGSTGFQTVPDRLGTVPTIPESEAGAVRRFELASGMGGRMFINGKTMNMDRIDERIGLGDTEIWDIVNLDGTGMGMMGGGMNQPHSFHIHSGQFRILDIDGSKPPPELSGWKDTVLLWPGDRIRIIMRFASFPGVYMYHCHLLEHEDNGMMGQFEIIEE